MTPDEGYELYTQAELPLLGMLDNEVCSHFHGDGIVTYTIDRTSIRPTSEDGVRIDNRVMVAHNCRVGAEVLIDSLTDLAG